MDPFALIWQINGIDVESVAALGPAYVFAIIFFLTFLTEDGACLLAGSLAAAGAIGFDTAVAACFLGIFVGDVGLYGLGRGFGKAIARTSLFRRILSPARLERASHWLEKRGFAAIFISRFVSGLRLPTYLAAGFLKTSFPKFVLYFVIAAAVWTPLIVGAAYFAQELFFGTNFLLGAVALYVAIRLVISLSTWRRRRRLAGFLKKIYKWEFWPVQIFYLPVVAYIVLLAVRHRSLTVFTCANPAIPAGGFIGESKDEIYKGLARSEAAAPFLLNHIAVDPEEIAEASDESLLSKLRSAGVSFPLVVKPDAGERGKAVRIVRELTDLRTAFEAREDRQILQEFADGVEFSVFYYRYPGDEKGRVYSATEKIFPTVTGDGVSTLEELILSDPRAVIVASTYLDNLEDDPDRIPEAGELIRLVEIGTHARGAIFKDGERVVSGELAGTIDRFCLGYEGFYFGRFDLRAHSAEALRRAEDFKIVELNGVTSESTNIYDERYSLFDAYAILFRQWKIAFRIGRMNRDRGARQYKVRELISMLFSPGGDHAKPAEEAA